MASTSRAKATRGDIAMNLKREAYTFARNILKSRKQADEFAGRLVEVCSQAKGKDFLIVHNPGGWGHARMENCLGWEKGTVNGVASVIQKMGYSLLVIQYFRSGFGCKEDVIDLLEQLRFFPDKAGKMASWLSFVIEHTGNRAVILVGVSQGAAFGNAVMQQLDEGGPVYSIELAFPFIYKEHRRTNKRTLAIDSNGKQPDKLVEGRLWDGVAIFTAAPFKWIGHRLRGEKVSLSHCVDAPGHKYDWGNPFIEKKIKDFLQANFAVR
jgi:hypothetical protein